MPKLLKRILSIVAALVAVLVIGIAIPSLYVRTGCQAVTKTISPALDSTLSSEISGLQETIPKYTRPEEKTYLTLPEWYIVYSAHEYADFLEHDLPSRFPYVAAIGQFWNTYCRVNTLALQYPSSAIGDHVSLMVIGTSYTTEYALKGLYENTIGRVSELVSGRVMVDEDTYAAQVGQEYARFLHTIPWYEFPFAHKLRGVWRDTSLFGPHFIRKVERKLFLTLEYGGKAVYGKVIGWATHATYGYQDLEIHAVIDHVQPHLFRDEPRLKLVKEINPGTYLIIIPRYEEFTELVLKLTDQGVHFLDIAGNDELLLTAVVPRDWIYDLSEGSILFEMPILTQSDQKRVAINAPVPALHTIINTLNAQQRAIEHVYDY